MSEAREAYYEAYLNLAQKVAYISAYITRKEFEDIENIASEETSTPERIAGDMVAIGLKEFQRLKLIEAKEAALPIEAGGGV